MHQRLREVKSEVKTKLLPAHEPLFVLARNLTDRSHRLKAVVLPKHCLAYGLTLVSFQFWRVCGLPVEIEGRTI